MSNKIVVLGATGYVTGLENRRRSPRMEVQSRSMTAVLYPPLTSATSGPVLSVSTATAEHTGMSA
ncbi:hypothetical protein ACWD00_21820 [Streptomyces viridiviolaceus]